MNDRNQKNKILGIIPARLNSKGIFKKNIRLLAGKPLIAYSIETALKSKYLERVIVSTDSEEIARIARKYGAEVPFIRPKKLAQDNTPMIDVVIHAFNFIKTIEYYEPEWIVLLQPTSPLRTADDIDNAIELAIKHNADSVVSVCECESNSHPYWLKKIENGKLVSFIKTKKKYPIRQLLPVVYRLNGAVYIVKSQILKKFKSLYGRNTIPYIMDPTRSIDIDTPLDFKFAEFLIKERYI